MANGDEWEDISDGGDDDWETGKPVAPRSGSGSGLSGSGSNGSVGTAPTSRHRPQSSWGADDDDWGGDEEDWRPAPVRPSPSNARGARARSPPRSPALTKGVSPARPAKGPRRWTRSRAACKRLGVLVCLVAAVVTLSSFGIFKGGGSGRGDEPWETRSEAFPSSDALERSARSFGDRPTTDFGSGDRSATAVGEDDGTDVGDSISIDARQDRRATRTNAPVITNAVVERPMIATITSEASNSLSEASADETERLKASHEHVSNKNAADVSLFPRRAGPAEDVSSVAVEKTKNALGRLGTEEPDGLDPTDLDADASVRLGSISEHVSDARDGLEETAASTTDEEEASTTDDAVAKEEEDDDENDSDGSNSSVFFETTDDSHDALPTEVTRSDANETPLGEDVEVLPRDAEKDAATTEKEPSHEEEEASTATVFGEIVDAAAADDVETVETAEAFGVGFGDVLIKEAFVSDDADNTASSGDGEEDGEEDGASSVDEKKKAFDSDLDPRDAIGPDADLPEEDASRAEDESSRFRSEEGPEEASDPSFADEEEEALVSSETRPVVSEDEASSAVSAAEKNNPAERNDEELINSSSSAPPPPPPPRPPPVPMDGPDMTDPVNRAALDAYQSREKYVAWSKKAAKLEGRIVAPTSTV
jgi:hypothetical protein